MKVYLTNLNYKFNQYPYKLISKYNLYLISNFFINKDITIQWITYKKDNFEMFRKIIVDIHKYKYYTYAHLERKWKHYLEILASASIRKVQLHDRPSYDHLQSATTPFPSFNVNRILDLVECFLHKETSGQFEKVWNE